MDVGSLENQQATGFDAFRHCGNKSFRRIDVFDHVKTRNDVEVAPRQSLDHVAKYGRDFLRVIRKTRIRLNAGYIERLTCHAQKISASAPHFQELSRGSEIPYQIKPPAGIQDSQPMLFLQPEISNVEVCRLDSAGNLGCISTSGTESQ